MDTKGRKLLRYVAGFMAAAALMSAAYTTTAMASSIGLIDTKELLDIRAEADDSSDVVGQVMDEGHVAILNRSSGWVQIKAGDIVGWVPEENLIETEVSNEEAVEANQEMIERLEEDAEESSAEADEEPDVPQTETQEEETQTSDSGPESTEDTERTDIPEDDAKTEDAEEEAGAVFTEEQIDAKKAAAEALAEQQEAAQAALEAAEKAEQEAARAAEEQKELLIRAEAQKQAILTAAGASEEDLRLLATIIYCEAGSEPYVGKVAVGSVVMNRVKSEVQPDTIHEVIYAKGQFSPVRNGSLKRALANNSADASCYQAAMEALTGQKPVGDKLYFRRVNGRPGQIIGRHVFF